ncbi:PREDICTED: RING finger protein 186 [Propithecus coquereli]|uniref:RING finger protein 186 n=1 Tax=Propithecus coquereli TaxID=379532 RepID=UPI00063F6AA8|nr:PREDICTED: RING finger protein 186 [Propithecus coquereli]
MQVPAAPAQALSSCIPPAPVPRMACTTTTTIGPTGGHRSSKECDLECLVCREPYSCARSPKLLACQHAFCVVCLKLLLCIQDSTWSITCPLCRKRTAVPGGLICGLRDQQAVMGRLARSYPEVRLSPQGLADPAASTEGHPSLAGEDGQDTVSANRAAARRLAAHLLLLILLIILILPFIYPGVIRWVLAFIIALALLMSTFFCYHPRQGSCSFFPRTPFCREQKDSQVSSIA